MYMFLKKASVYMYVICVKVIYCILPLVHDVYMYFIKERYLFIRFLSVLYRGIILQDVKWYDIAKVVL